MFECTHQLLLLSYDMYVLAISSDLAPGSLICTFVILSSLVIFPHPSSLDLVQKNKNGAISFVTF